MTSRLAWRLYATDEEIARMIRSESALLQALMLAEDKSAQDLIRLIQETTAGRLSLSEGIVYPRLRKLEGMGLVEMSFGVSASGLGRRRAQYRLTARGRKVAQEERRAVLRLFGQSAKS